MKATENILTEKDLEKLKIIQKSISDGNACLYDKGMCLKYLDSIINPKCSICRKPLQGEIELIRDHKMHIKCSKRYPA